MNFFERLFDLVAPVRVQVPPLALGAAPSDYFWHNLPYGFPGLLTFAVGLSLAFLALRAAGAAFSSLRPALLYFAATTIAVGALGCLQAVFCLVQDGVLLRRLADLLFCLGAGLPFFVASLIASLLRRPPRVLQVIRWLGLLCAAVLLTSVLLRSAYLPATHTYYFGLVPALTNVALAWSCLALVGVIPLVTMMMRSGRRSRALCLRWYLLCWPPTSPGGHAIEYCRFNRSCSRT